MNQPGDYDVLDMAGLRSDLYEDVVDVEHQKTLVAAFPELRMIWNAHLACFQLVCRAEDVVTPMYGRDGGMVLMRGWEIIPGNHVPPVSIDQIVRQLRVRQHMATEECQKLGFENLTDYADHLAAEIERRRKAEENAKFNDFLGIVNEDTGAMAAIRPGVIRSYGTKVRDMLRVTRMKDLPVAPAHLERAATPANNFTMGAKERRKLAARTNAALREGAPL